MRFSFRLTALGFVFVVMFSVLALRLWAVQVADGAQIAEQVQEQTWIERDTQAARGDIFDRTGELLVTSRYVPAVEVDRTFVHPSERDELVQRLSSLLGMPASEIDEMYEEAGTNGRFTVGVISSVLSNQLAESLSMYPGVDIVKVPERVYLSGPDLAHVVGHLGLPDDTDLDARPDLNPNVRIGKLGVERVYDEELQGTPGRLEYRAARGEIVESRPSVEPRQGDSLHLTVDLRLQEVVARALEEGVDLANQVKEAERDRGEEIFSEAERAAAVVMDVNTGQVVALASHPDFDPQQFVSGIDPATFATLQETNAFNNLAVSGLYPPASTFKVVTYAAAEQFQLPFPEDVEGVDPPARRVHCDGTLVLPTLADGSEQVKRDWYDGNKGWLDVHGALEQSCNIYFWSVALGVWRNRDEVDVNTIQDLATDLGYGQVTGIDLTAEAEGIVPTPELFEEWAQTQRDNPNLPPRMEPSRLDLAAGPWVGGDLMDFAIGQGALTATPLQVAVSYAALVNGGDVLRPTVTSEIRGRDGQVVHQTEPEVVRTLDLDPSVHASLRADLSRVVTDGTASAAFADFGPGVERLGGKTGTGQTSPGRDNHAWFVGLAPVDATEYVVVVLIDEGGSGGQVAAPVARHIMQELMGNDRTPIVEGEAAD